MNDNNFIYLELLEKRIELFKSLTASLLSARSTMGAVDMDGLELRISQQQVISADIRKLDEEIERLQYQCAAHLRMHGGEQSLANIVGLDEALLRLHQARATVKQLHEAHQALLSRSSRTVTAFLDSLRTFAGTHRNPALHHAPGPSDAAK